MGNTHLKSNLWKNLSPWIGTIIILPVVIYYAFNGGRFTWIDYINLLIHEGGHGIFKIFGKFIYSLGGTLMQIIVPGMFVVFYLFKRKKFSAQVFLVWLGENLLNISVYAADARSKSLPLLGGKNVYHDWNWILSKTGLLEFDYAVGYFFSVSAFIVFILALLIPLLIREYETANLPLDL